MTLKTKAGISISIIFVLGLAGYSILRFGKISRHEKSSLEKSIPDSLKSNKLDEFHVGDGTSMFLISKISPSASNIFFVQRSCDTHRPDQVRLSSAQAVSINSAAIQNPTSKVILLYTCPHAKFINLNSPSSGYVRTLLDLPNFYFAHMNQTNMVFDRVFGEFERRVPNSTKLSETYDEIVKFLVAYEFGGTYMDMDLIYDRPLDNLGHNFICAESEYSIGDSFFNFEPKHPFLKEFLLTVHERRIAHGKTTALLTAELRKFCSLEKLFKFDIFHNLTQCNLKVLAASVLDDSNRTEEYLSKSGLLMTEDKLLFKPHLIRGKNAQNPKMPSNEPTNQQYSDISGYENKSSVFQTDGYWTYTKLSPSSNNIYFLETSCTSFKPSDPSNTHVISARQACAIHSTAFYNPSRKVILLYTCHGFADISFGLTKTLFELPNFSMGRINLTDFYSNSALDLKMRESLRKSEFPVHQNADILRLLVLYLYGGTYMDLDIISLKPLTDLGTNFIGAEYHQFVANGVLSFEAQHTFIKECLKEAINSYVPSALNSIGPPLLSKVIRDRCGLKMIPQKNWLNWNPFEEVRILKNCNMTVLPSEYFYAVPYWEWARFYKESELPSVQFELQHSYIAHFWQRMGSAPVFMFGDQPYAQLAKQHCNAIFEYEHKRGCFYLE